MKIQMILLSIAILFLTSPRFCHGNVCIDSPGASYLDCSHSPPPDTPQLECCTDYTYTGPKPQKYEFRRGDVYITITNLSLAPGETITIKAFECDGLCKDLVIDSSVQLPLRIHIVNPRFTILSSDADSFLTFFVDGPKCVCEGIEGKNPCNQIFLKDPTNPISGVYNVFIHGASYEIFCEFKSGGQGCVYISQNALVQNHLHVPIEKFHNDDAKACLKFKSANGQKDNVLEQLTEYNSMPLSFQVNAHEGYALQSHDDIVNPPYIFLGLIPKDLISKDTIQGYNHNGNRYAFTNCDNNPNSNFAFVAEPLTGTHLTGNRPWIGSATNAVVNLPDGFFYYCEEHQGGCGAYFHRGWVALGLPFNY